MPNHPAAGKAGIAHLSAVEHHWLGLPEPGRLGLQQTHAYGNRIYNWMHLLLSVLGCKHETRPAQSAPAGSKTVSDGNYSWTLGAATRNGTNVPLTNLTIRAITNQTPK